MDRERTYSRVDKKWAERLIASCWLGKKSFSSIFIEREKVGRQLASKGRKKNNEDKTARFCCFILELGQKYFAFA